MAASVKNMVRVTDDKSSSSSSEDDEALRRCQEAVWESRTVKDKEEDKVKESKRVVVADHEHDGNDLQVSQGFRTHVAKKLGHFLDSCISETKSSSCVASAKCDDDEDEGFRLFSTSVPGQTEEPPAPVRRRPVPSSSDSDSEMESRLREAAVSIKDLLPSAALPSSALSPSSTQPPSSGKIKKKKNVVVEEEECQIIKKKKKRRRTGEESVQVDCTRSLSPKSSGEQQSSEQEHPQVKVKPKKKKKRCEGNIMD